MAFGDFLADHLGGTVSTGLTWDGKKLPQGSRGLGGRFGTFALKNAYRGTAAVATAMIGAPLVPRGVATVLPFFQRLQPGSGASPLPGPNTFGPNASSGCSFITDWRLRAACEAVSGWVGGGGGGGGGGGALSPCPTGYHRGSNGQCIIDGLGSYLPGDVGRPDIAWTAVNGRYGAGYQPVEEARRHLVCPTGFKLGKDEICYECLTKKERKWNPGTRPFMTGGDLNAVARVKRLKGRGRKMMSTLGLNSSGRGRSSGGKKRRR